MRRYIVTGAPGAGKTTLLRELAREGYPFVAEAATDIIAEQQAGGAPEPWTDTQFLLHVLRLQMVRQERAAADRVVLFDRSPICTLALARYSDRPVPSELAVEVDRIVSGAFYEPRVFLVRSLGFIEATAARRISYEDSLRFEAVHESTYRALGFTLVDVPPASIDTRAAAVREAITVDAPD